MSLNRKEADGTYTEVAGVPVVTKENIGLGNVENKSSEQIRDEITKENVVNALGSDPTENIYIDGVVRSNGKYYLSKNITVNSPITIKNGTIFDLNGYEITVASEFSGTAVFIVGENEDWHDIDKVRKYIGNGTINLNNTTAALADIHSGSGLVIGNITAYNAHNTMLLWKGLYEGSFGEPYGGICVKDVNYYKDKNFDSGDMAGLNIWTTDSVFSNIQTVYFRVGIRAKRGSNVFNACHPWGYPNRTNGEYPLSSICQVGMMLDNVSNCKLVGCYADTCDPISEDTNDRYNYGIGFFVCGTNINLIGCSSIFNFDSAKSIHYNRIGIWISDRPFRGAGSLFSRNINVSCFSTPRLYYAMRTDDIVYNPDDVKSLTLSAVDTYDTDNDLVATSLNQIPAKGFVIKQSANGEKTSDSKLSAYDFTLFSSNNSLAFASKFGAERGKWGFLRPALHNNYFNNYTTIKGVLTDLLAEYDAGMYQTSYMQSFYLDFENIHQVGFFVPQKRAIVGYDGTVLVGE